MADTIRLNLELLLPEVDSVRDSCVRRLIDRLESRGGVVDAHVLDQRQAAASKDAVGLKHVLPDGDSAGPQLCLHYDPERLSLADVSAFAKSTGAELSQRYGHLAIQFRRVGTEDYGGVLEDALRDVPGVLAASVNFPAQMARVEYDRSVAELPELFRALERAGAIATRAHGSDAVPRLPSRASVAAWAGRFSELTWSLLSGALLALAWGLERLSGEGAGAPVILYLGAYVLGAQDSVRHFFRDLRRGRIRVGIDLLMVVAAAGAAFIGEWAEGGLLLFLFSLGHALEHYALGRARGAIKALGDLVPQQADVLRDGKEVRLSIGDVQVGDQVIVKPGQRVPVDGSVVQGSSAVNQAPITGESVPVEKVAGSPMFAGSINGDGALVVGVTAAIGDRTLDRVVKLVSEAETQKAPTQQFTERFERIFVPAVLAVVALLMIGLPTLGVTDVRTAVYRGLAALIAAAPCALALGTPAAVLAGIGQAARNGVLIKGGAHLETLGTVTVLAVDKTGTITLGEPVVTDLRPAPGSSESELLRKTAAAERRSQHPLARAIIREADKRGEEIPPAENMESVTGRGLRAGVDGKVIEVGRELLFQDQGLEVPKSILDAAVDLERLGRTTVLVREVGDQGARWLGVIGIADEPRPHVAATLTALRQSGIRRIVMLTGDNEGVARAVGEAVGIEDVQAGLLPEDKVRAVKKLSSRDVVAMVGDGVNDAAALAHAAVGIAMGGAGTAAALETADVALMADDLGKLPFAIGLSRRARAIIKQNLAISLAVIGLLLVASLTGLTGIGWAVIVHEGSTLVVIANALRLLGYRAEAIG